MSKEIMQQALDKFRDLKGLLKRLNRLKQRDEVIELIAALEAELAKPQNEFNPDWDQIKPYHDRIAELESELAKIEQPQTDLRKAAEMLMKALDDGWVERGDSVVIALRQALAQPEQTETHNLVHEIDLVLTDSESDLSEGAVRALQYVSKQLEALAQPEQTEIKQGWDVDTLLDKQEYFCDTHCVHTDHHPDCELAQPEQANPIDTYERAYYEGKRAGIAESEAIKTQPAQEPMSFQTWRSRQHGDPEEIGFLQALKHAYESGQYSVSPPRKEWVGLTDDERFNLRVIVQSHTDIDDASYGVKIQYATEEKLMEKNNA